MLSLALHRGVVGLDVDGAGEEHRRLVPEHQELVDAAELLLGEVLARLGDDDPGELLVDLGVAVLQIDVLELVEGQGLLEDPFMFGPPGRPPWAATRFGSESLISSLPVMTPSFWLLLSARSRISRILLVIQNSRPCDCSGERIGIASSRCRT